MFALTGDSMYKEKAKEVADKLLPAFQTKTGLPRSTIDIETDVSVSFDQKIFVRKIILLHITIINIILDIYPLKIG